MLAGGSIIIEGEQIVAVSSHAYAAGSTARETILDMTGRIVLPGIICLHNDGLERAINPRPECQLSARFRAPYL